MVNNSNIQTNSIFKTASILTGPYELKTYPDVVLPQKIKDDINVKRTENYDCVVTNVDNKTGHIFFRFLKPNQTFDNTLKIQNDLRNFFGSKTAQSDYYFSYNFIRDSLKKSIRLACVCKNKDEKLYRCEIISEQFQEKDAVKKFLVFAVDYGFLFIVTIDALFRPFISHIGIERQVFTFKLKPNLEKQTKPVYIYI